MTLAEKVESGGRSTDHRLLFFFLYQTEGRAPADGRRWSYEKPVEKKVLPVKVILKSKSCFGMCFVL